MLQVMQQKNFSENTIRTYIGCLGSMAKNLNKSPDLLTVSEINEYFLRSFVGKKLGGSAIRQTIGALKILYVYVLKRNWNKIDFPRPKAEKKYPNILSKEDVKSIINVTRNLKHKTLIMLAYSSGLRLGELLNLRLEDIDSKRMQILVKQAKGHKDRNVILSPLILTQLRIYWKEYQPVNYLFEGFSRNRKYSYRSAQNIIKRSVQLAGIKRKVTFHTLRHSFATHLVEDGVDVIIVQRLLGHTTLKTTSVYLHLQNYDISKVQSPLDTLILQK